MQDYHWNRRKPRQLERLVHLLRIGSGSLRGITGGLRNAPIQFADIGARGGLARSWQILWRLGLVNPIFVEPEPKAARDLIKRYPDARLLEAALAEESADDVTLYVTKQPGCTSLLRPALPHSTPPMMRWMFEITEEIPMSTVRSETAFSEAGLKPEVMKLDVQGLELPILKGLGPLLDGLVAIELEVPFVLTYANQPGLQEISDFLLDRGFGLVHVSAFGVATTGSAIQGNAVFTNRSLNTDRSRLIEDLTLAAIGAGYAP